MLAVSRFLHLLFSVLPSDLRYVYTDKHRDGETTDWRLENKCFGNYTNAARFFSVLFSDG